MTVLNGAFGNESLTRHQPLPEFLRGETRCRGCLAAGPRDLPAAGGVVRITRRISLRVAGSENEHTLVLFLNSPRVQMLCTDEATSHHFAHVFAQPRLQGTPIPVHDIWIAALAIQHNLVLFIRDKHFDHLP